MLNRKGISAVVATVLIIMITVATVAIVWAFIIPMIKDVLIESTSEKAELSIETDGGYTTWDEVQKIARVQVKRGNDKLNLTGIDFSFIKQGNTEKRTNETVPQKNQLKVYEFNLSDFGKPEEIKIAPITAAGVGEVVSESDVINNYGSSASSSGSISYSFISYASAGSFPNLNNTLWHDYGEDLNGENIYYNENDAYAYWNDGETWLISNVSDVDNESLTNFFRPIPVSINVINFSSGQEGDYPFLYITNGHPVYGRVDPYLFQGYYVEYTSQWRVFSNIMGGFEYYTNSINSYLPPTTSWEQSTYGDLDMPVITYTIPTELTGNSDYSGSINMTAI